ncbi:Nucleolar pre-ribosomal-associated protein 1 [Nymphon striatum]|nr:Nucleolar pre-ribosomal-associated protein 1 [Nymphon striatum]
MLVSCLNHMHRELQSHSPGDLTESCKPLSCSFQKLRTAVNQNHIVSNILKLFDKPFKNPHIAALVINVLKSCPDQVMPYLVFLKSNILEPRASSNWVEAMNFFKQILEEQNTLKVLENETILTPLKLAEVIISLTLPVRIFTKEFISQCLIHDSFDVRKLIVDILLGALENISKIYKSGEKNEKLLEIISDILAKNLPEVSALISCWQLSNTLDEEQQFNSSTLEVFVNITKILSVYQTMLPGNFNSSSNDLCNLLISIEKTRENFVETEWLKLYLQILNLLSEGQNYKILLSQSVLKILIKTCLATNFELSESAVKVLLGIVEKSVGYSNVIRLITWLQVLRKTKSKDDLSEFFVEILLHAAEAESVANNSDEVSSSRCEGIHCALIENGFKILQVNKYSKKSYMSFLSSVVTAQIHFQPEPKIFCVFLSKYSEFMTEGLRVYIKVWTDGLNAVIGAKIKKLDQNATIQEQLQKILVNQSENFSSFVSCFKELQFSDEQILMEIANQISLYISVLQSCKDTRLSDFFDFLDIMFKTLNSEAQNVMYPIILRNINIKDNFSVTGSEISEKTQNSVLNIFECCAVCDSNILSFYSEKSKQLLINNLSSSIEPDYISLNNILRTFVNHFDNYSCLDIINSSKFSNMIKIDLVNLENLLTKCTRAISEDKVPKLASSFVRNFGDYISQVDDENIRRALLNILDALPIYAVIISKAKKKKLKVQKLISAHAVNENLIRIDALPVYQVFYSENISQLLHILFTTLISSEENAHRISEIPLTTRPILSAPSDFENAKSESSMEKFTTFALKNGMKYHGQDLNLLKILAYLYKIADVNGLVTTATVYTMTISHSKFLSIMFDTAKAQQPQKVVSRDNCDDNKIVDASNMSSDEWVDKSDINYLMLSLVQSDNNICSEKHIPVFLGAYSATFSVIDHLALMGEVCLICVLRIDDKPEPSLSGILSMDCEDSCEEVDSFQDLYDPRFLFPLFSNLLAPENFVYFPKFIETGCLSYIFASLASYQTNMRSAAYHLLESFYMHLEGARKFRSRQALSNLPLAISDYAGPLFKKMFSNSEISTGTGYFNCYLKQLILTWISMCVNDGIYFQQQVRVNQNGQYSARIRTWKWGKWRTLEGKQSYLVSRMNSTEERAVHKRGQKNEDTKLEISDSESHDEEEKSEIAEEEKSEITEEDHDHNKITNCKSKLWTGVANQLNMVLLAILANISEMDTEDLQILFSLLLSVLQYNCSEDLPLQDFVNSWLDSSKVPQHHQVPDETGWNNKLIQVILHWKPNPIMPGCAEVIVKVADLFLEELNFTTEMLKWLLENLKQKEVVRLLISDTMKKSFYKILNLYWRQLDLQRNVYEMILTIFQVASDFDEVPNSTLLHSIKAIEKNRFESFELKSSAGSEMDVEMEKLK